VLAVKESVALTQIRLALGDQPGVILWRNSTGVARAASGHHVRYGLAVGSADLIGIVDGRFVALEVKSDSGRLRPEQELYLELVRKHGGFAAVVRDGAEALAAIARCRAGESL
jgi:hypothetical protein